MLYFDQNVYSSRTPCGAQLGVCFLAVADNIASLLLEIKRTVHFDYGEFEGQLQTICSFFQIKIIVFKLTQLRSVEARCWG